jgi:hypothetical protein
MRDTYRHVVPYTRNHALEQFPTDAGSSGLGLRRLAMPRTSTNDEFLAAVFYNRPHTDICPFLCQIRYS